MPFVSIQGVDTYYEVTGSGPALILISGLGGSGRFWGPNIAALAQHFTVVVYDQRGTDRSGRPEMDYTIPLLASDVIGLMDHLKITSASFIGHSTGGAICQILATEHPSRVDAMVLYASWPASDEHFRWCFQVRRALLDGVGAEAYAHGAILFLYPPWYVQENAEALHIEAANSALLCTPYAVVTSRIDAILAFDWLERLDAVRVPTLVLCAEDDVLTPPYQSRRLASAIRESRLTILETGAHSASRVVPNKFNDAVLGFLAAR